MNWFIETLRAHPEIALFLTLALTHLSSRYPLSEVEAEAQIAFGQVSVPHDLDRAEIAPRSGAFGAVTLVRDR